MPDANLTRSLMYMYDCFLDDFCDAKYVSMLLDLDMRAQVEVTLNYMISPKIIGCLFNYTDLLYRFIKKNSICIHFYLFKFI